MCLRKCLLTTYLYGICIAFLISCKESKTARQAENQPVAPEDSSDNARLFFKHFGRDQGLPSSEIWNTFSDKQGFVWLATGKGVLRFDGLRFETFFDEPKKNIHLAGSSSFLEDKKGDLWVFSGTGHLHRFDRKTHSFVPKASLLENGWSEQRPMDLTTDSLGNFWFGGYGGLQYFDRQTDSITVFPVSKIRTMDWPYEEKVRIERIQTGNDGNLWLGSRKFGLIKFNKKDKKYTFFRDKVGFLDAYLDDWVTDIVASDKGILWISDYEKGLIEFEVKTEKVIKLWHLEELLGSSQKVNIRDLHVENHNLWIATQQHGVLVFNLITKTLERQFHNEPSSQSSLADNEVRSIHRDDFGNYWMAGRSLALASPLLYEFETIAMSTTFSSDKSMLNALGNTTEGSVLLATGNGLKKIDRKGQVHAISTLASRNYLSVLASKDRSIWVSDDQNLYHYSSDFSQLISTFPRTLIVDEIGNELRKTLRLYEDSRGFIWAIDHWNRLKYIDPKIGQAKNVFALAQDSVSKKFIQVLCVLDDPENKQILVGTDLGIALVSSSNFSVKWPSNGNSIETLKENCSYLYRDKKGEVWAVFSNILYKLDAKTFELTPFRFKDRENHMSYTWVVEEPLNQLWLNTTAGIIHYDTRTAKSTLFPNGNFSEGSFEKPSPVSVSDNSIYFGGDRGLSIIHPSELVQSKSPPKVSFESVTIPFKNGLGSVSDSVVYLTQNESLSLDYYQNRLQINYSGIHFKNSELNTFSYQLKGFDSDFKQAGTQQFAAYTNLSPGDYLFELKAANADGVWSEIQILPIHIRPPWWHTWWAYFIYFTLFSLLIYGWIKYRVYIRLQKFKATEAIRSKISADLHDDVGSILSGLSMKSELMSYTAKKDQQNDLAKISEMSRNAMELMRDTVWAIDSRKDKFENLTDRMRTFSEASLPLKNISYTFETSGFESSGFINPEIRQNIYLIFKEALTNVLKHSDASRVKIELTQKDKHLMLIIQDNGKNKQAKPSDGLGMSNMKERAAKIGGVLFVRNQAGFVVELEIPV